MGRIERGPNVNIVSLVCLCLGLGILTGCSKGKSKPSQNAAFSGPAGGGSTGGSGGGASGGIVVITSPVQNGTLAVLANYTSFPITGTCTQNAEDVTIRDSGGALLATTPCVGGQWSTTINLTTATEGVAVVLTVANGSGGTPATRSVVKTVAHCQSQIAETTLASSGNGTLAEPWLICNKDQLDDVRNRLAAGSQYFELLNNIDLGGGVIQSLFHPTWGGGPWQTLLDDHFEGNGLKIHNGTIRNDPAGDHIAVELETGLFLQIGGSSTVQNLVLEDLALVPRNINHGAGILANSISSAANVSNIVIRNCSIADVTGERGLLATYIAGTVTNVQIIGGSISSVGGVVGYNVGALAASLQTGATATNIHSTAQILTPNVERAAGLISFMGTGTTLSNCSVEADLQLGPSSGSGGLVWRMYGTASISDCHYSGTIQAPEGISGLVGGMFDDAGSSGHIANSYSTGHLEIAGGVNCFWVGGLVGEMSSTSLVEDSYSTMDILASPTCSQVGGLVGRANGTLTRVYATGDIVGEDIVGGFAGVTASTATISKAFATGNVTATAGIAGGFASTGDGTITDAYAWGNVTASGEAGGFIVNIADIDITRAYSLGTVTGSTYAAFGGHPWGGLTASTDIFWNVFTSGFVGTGTMAGAVGVGLGALGDDSMARDLVNYTGFDGSGNWKIDPALSPYPVLIWQTE